MITTNSNIDPDFIKHVEDNYFRTNQDIGANLNTLFIWNLVRNEAGLGVLRFVDLPAYCITHERYHQIKEEYGCKRVKP
jgi:hypothetical protein